MTHELMKFACPVHLHPFLPSRREISTRTLLIFQQTTPNNCTKYGYPEYILEFIDECLVSEGDADVRHVGECDVVPGRTLDPVVHSQPVLLHLTTTMSLR